MALVVGVAVVAAAVGLLGWWRSGSDRRAAEACNRRDPSIAGMANVEVRLAVGTPLTSELGSRLVVREASVATGRPAGGRRGPFSGEGRGCAPPGPAG